MHSKFFSIRKFFFLFHLPAMPLFLPLFRIFQPKRVRVIDIRSGKGALIATIPIQIKLKYLFKNKCKEKFIAFRNHTNISSPIDRVVNNADCLQFSLSTKS